MSPVIYERRVMIDDAHAETKEVIDLSHPHRVTAREVVVHRYDVHAFSFERVEVRGERRNERLPFAGPPLRDAAIVEHRSAHELDVKMPLTERPARRFTDKRECFG